MLAEPKVAARAVAAVAVAEVLEAVEVAVGVAEVEAVGAADNSYFANRARSSVHDRIGAELWPT